MRYAAAIAFLLLIGLVFNAGLLVYSAYTLGTIFLLTRYLTKRWIEDCVVTRELTATELEIGDELQVSLQLKNRGRWPILWILAEDILSPRILFGPPPSVQMIGSPMRLCWIPARGARVLSYRLKMLRRGYHQIGPTVLETGDWLGLHRRFHVATEPQYVMVLPKIVPLEGYEIASRRPVGEIQVTYRLMEDPTLISGIRTYQAGDPLSRVHWQATARTGTLHSKVYQPTSVAGATLIIDLHRDSNPDRHEPVRSDLAVTAAVAISHTLYQMQQQFGMITNGRDAADRVRTDGWESDFRTRAAAQKSLGIQDQNDRLRPIIVPTNRSPEQFNQILRTLARVERTDGLKLPQLLLETQSRLPRDATLLIIVQQVDDEAALALSLLRRQGYAISAIVNHYEHETFTTAASRLLSIQIPVYHLFDEQSIPGICRNLVLKY